MGGCKRNCWTCGWDREGGICDIQENDAGREGLAADTGDWCGDAYLDAYGMPPKDADGCPGWKPKPGAETWPEHIKIGARVMFADPIEDSGVVFDGRGRVIVLQTHKGERECIIQHDDGSQARYPLSVARDVFVAEVPKPGAENADRIGPVVPLSCHVSAVLPNESGDTPYAHSFLADENTDRAQVAALADSATIRPDSATGWRGHIPICRGPGGIMARKLRKL